MATKKICLLIALVPSMLFAKGLDELNPQVPVTVPSSTEPEVKVETKVEETKQAVAKELNRFEKEAAKTQLGTGFGFVRAFKGTKTDLRANGMAEIRLTYTLDGVELMSHPLRATFRYAPFNIAPVNEDNTYQAFTGIVEAYAVGAETTLDLLPQHFESIVGAEFAYLKVDLNETIPLEENVDDPINSGAQLSVGFEARFKPMEALHVGPKLYLGFGTITTVQLLVAATLIN